MLYLIWEVLFIKENVMWKLIVKIILNIVIFNTMSNVVLHTLPHRPHASPASARRLRINPLPVEPSRSSPPCVDSDEILGHTFANPLSDETFKILFLDDKMRLISLLNAFIEIKRQAKNQRY